MDEAPEDGPATPRRRPGEGIRPHVGIVGSRDYPDPVQVAEYVMSLPPDTVVVSGGAHGPDAWAAHVADAIGLQTIVHKANWLPEGHNGPLDRAAGMKRNHLIVADAHRLVAFHHRNTSGTRHTINIARARNKPILVLVPRKKA